MSKTQSAFERFNHEVLKTYDQITKEARTSCAGCGTELSAFESICTDCKAQDDADAHADHEAREGLDV